MSEKLKKRGGGTIREGAIIRDNTVCVTQSTTLASNVSTVE